jgi:hypothetical protein
MPVLIEAMLEEYHSAMNNADPPNRLPGTKRSP